MPKLAGKSADGRAVNEAVRRAAALNPPPASVARSAAASAGAATMTSRILGIVRKQALLTTSAPATHTL